MLDPNPPPRVRGQTSGGGRQTFKLKIEDADVDMAAKRASLDRIVKRAEAEECGWGTTDEESQAIYAFYNLTIEKFRAISCFLCCRVSDGLDVLAQYGVATQLLLRIELGAAWMFLVLGLWKCGSPETLVFLLMGLVSLNELIANFTVCALRCTRPVRALAKYLVSHPHAIDVFNHSPLFAQSSSVISSGSAALIGAVCWCKRYAESATPPASAVEIASIASARELFASAALTVSWLSSAVCSCSAANA